MTELTFRSGKVCNLILRWDTVPWSGIICSRRLSMSQTRFYAINISLVFKLHKWHLRTCCSAGNICLCFELEHSVPGAGRCMASVPMTILILVLSMSRCSGTVGAIVTCPLEVLKTRLQSSGLTLRPVFQVQLGTLSGTGVIRPGTVTPGLLQVLRYVVVVVGKLVPLSSGYHRGVIMPLWCVQSIYCCWYMHGYNSFQTCLVAGWDFWGTLCLLECLICRDITCFVTEVISYLEIAAVGFLFTTSWSANESSPTFMSIQDILSSCLFTKNRIFHLASRCAYKISFTCLL